MRYVCSTALASSSDVPTLAVISRSWVMNSDTGRSKSPPSQNRMSRLVRMPTRRPSGSVIGIPEKRKRFISSSASCSFAVGGSVTGSEIIPLWLRLTFCTSAACSTIDRLRWITPIPPVTCHRDRHAGLGHLVHRRRDQRHRELDVGGERGRGVDRVGQRLGVAGDDDDVVERQRLEAVEEVVIGMVVVDRLSE